MVQIQDVLPYLQAAGQLALVVGALFAAYQLWHLKRNRSDQADLQTLNAFNNHEFRKAFATVNALPLQATEEQVRQADAQDAATTVMMTFEVLGVLVYNRRLSIKTVDEAIGGFLRESWRRLENFVLAQRGRLGSPRYGEWYQWLFEHLPVNARRERGAYEVFRGWRA